MQRKTIMGLEYKWEMLLVYLISILGFVFSFMKEKDVSDDVRFQYNQAGTIWIVNIAATIISYVFGMIGISFVSSICSIITFILMIFSIIAIVKAFSNETYSIPVISDLSKTIWK